MQLIQTKHRMTLAGVVAASAVCLLGAIHQTLVAPQQDARHSVHAGSSGTISSETIPFEPRVVHPGYGSHMEAFRQESLRSQVGRSASRDLLFRDEDRKTFKALHPFLLNKPQAFPVQKSPKEQ
jgi:hypothetical protein